MNTLIIKKEDRGSADYGWLKPNHYFSFGGYRNDSRVHFGALRVVNDDFIAGGGKFETHPHDNMEIVTIPFTGKLKHKDSTGGEGVISAGDVQIMSAGTGVKHSEANASATESVTLFQIWVFPKIKNITPRYDQKTFDSAGRQNRWQTIVSPVEADKALFINQDAKFLLCDLGEDQSISYEAAFPNSGFFIINISGDCQVGEDVLSSRDAIGISEQKDVNISSSKGCSILLMEVPMSF